MNTYNVNDKMFKESEIYNEYLKDNPGIGFLKIRAYAASQAIPIANLKVVISKRIGSDKVIFYEGATNESGIIEKIDLPAPKLDSSNLSVPSSTSYDVSANYLKDNTTSTYKVNIYEGIYVVQTINIVPTMNVMAGGN